MLEPAHLDRDFDYLVPAEMDELAQPGVRVRVRFSGRLVDGFLLERLERSDHTGTLMRLERVVSGERVLTPEILRLITAVAARYAGTRADVLRLAIPPRHARTEAGQARSKQERAAQESAAETTSETMIAADPAAALDASGPGECPATKEPFADGESAQPDGGSSASGTADSVGRVGFSRAADAGPAVPRPGGMSANSVPRSSDVVAGRAAASGSAGIADSVGRVDISSAGAQVADATAEVPRRAGMSAGNVPQSSDVVAGRGAVSGSAAGCGSAPPDGASSDSGFADSGGGVEVSSARGRGADTRGAVADGSVEQASAGVDDGSTAEPGPGAVGRASESEADHPAAGVDDVRDFGGRDGRGSAAAGGAASAQAGEIASNHTGARGGVGDDGAGTAGDGDGDEHAEPVAGDSDAVQSHLGGVQRDTGGAVSTANPNRLAAARDDTAPAGDRDTDGATQGSGASSAEPDAVRTSRANDAARVDVSRLTEWSRYRHGASFLSALAAGKGPRAAWQALPGEDWARRLAEVAAVVAGGGRGVVVMVPDQRDLDRVLAACTELVGEGAVGLAAGLGPAARYRRWLAALRGTARIVVGTRSSVFAPVHDLGLIVIWDDGDDTYAEPRSPYPHAREVAMLRAHESGAAFVAGGFARTAEIQAVVDSGWAHDLVADRAVVRQYAPRISAPGDSDVALERDPVARAVRIPAVAFTAARKALAAGDPVLVQVPRRGYVPALSCARCRTPARCRHCNGPLALPGEPGAARPAGDAARPGSARELGVALSRRRSEEVAHSPRCRWCGRTDAAFRCGACGARALRAVVIGAARTAEELGRAFPGVPIRGSGGATVLDSVSEGAQVVVSTIGAEPSVPGGYGVALLLDGWALLGRADLRAAEDALRRWMSAAALVRSTGQVIVMAEPSLPTVQALVRWDPVTHAEFELAARAEVRFPPAVRLAALDGTTDSIAELLGEAQLPAGVEVLGPVPLPPGARTPFSAGDAPAEIERMILRADRDRAAALSRALTAALAVRSTRRSGDPLRVQIDPIDIG